MKKDVATLCECSKCGEAAQSIKGTQHRRCGGSAKAKPREATAKLPTAARGVWQ